jgi:hypothetical protein
VATFVRGTRVAEDGHVTAQPGQGRFVHPLGREPS